METTKQWKDLFNKNNNNKPNQNKTKNDFMIIDDMIKSNSNGIYIREKIPQSIIKKSIKDAYKNKFI
jgi:hypothetical protein